MPFQPINFANIAPIGKPWARDFAENLKKGMETYNLPQKLLGEREHQALMNAFNREKVQQEQAQTPFAAQNAQNAATENQVKADFAQPAAQAALRKAVEEGRLTAEQAKYFGGTALANQGLARAQTELTNRSASLPLSASFPNTPVGQMAALAEYGKQVGKGSQEYQDAEEAVRASNAQDATRGMTAEQKHDAYMDQLRSIVQNPNVPPADRAEARTKLTQNESRAIIKANGQKVANQLSSGVPMQQSIKKLITRPLKGYDKKTGQPVYDNSPLWYLSLYSGVDGKTRLANDILTKSPNYKKHIAAKNLAHTANDQFTAYNKLSVQPKSSKERLKIFDPSSLLLGQEGAYDAALDGINTLTMEHQATADEARSKAGLPLQSIDVMGKRRNIPSEYGERQDSGQSFGGVANPQQNMDFMRNQQQEYRAQNPQQQGGSKQLYWNGSDFVEGGFK